MADILAPEVNAPFLSEEKRFQLSELRGKWVLIFFAKQGKLNTIESFLEKVQKWTAEQDPQWVSFNCQVVVVVNTKDSVTESLAQNGSILAVFDEDSSMSLSFHCCEEDALFQDVATVLIDPEG